MSKDRITTRFFAVLLVPSSLLLLLIQEFAVRFVFPEFEPTRQLYFKFGDNKLPTLGNPNSSHRLIKNSGDYDVTVTFNKYVFRDKNNVARANKNCAMVVTKDIPSGSTAISVPAKLIKKLS